MLLKIVKAECWKCKKDMRIAFLEDTISVKEFDEKAIALAKTHGVLIEERYSGTREEVYQANVCPHCNSMFGEWYLPNYWYDEPIELVKIEN